MSQRSPVKSPYKPSYLEQNLPSDLYNVLQKNLDTKELAALRTTNRAMGERTAKEYVIGLDDNSYSQYPGGGKRSGWGMKFFKSTSTGEIWGNNKNNSKDQIDLDKRYKGRWNTVRGVETLKTEVFYDDTDQINSYEGVITKEDGDLWFRGTSTVLVPAMGSTRKEGDQAEIVGRVRNLR